MRHKNGEPPLLPALWKGKMHHQGSAILSRTPESLFSINARFTAKYLMVKNETITLNAPAEPHRLLLRGPPQTQTS